MKTKMRTLLLIIGSLILIAATVQACGIGHIVKGNGKIIKKTFDISDYRELYINKKAQIIYEQKEDKLPYLEIEIDENLLDLIKVNNEANALKISNKKIIKATKYIIRTNSKNLELLKLSGEVKANIIGKLQSDVLNLSTSGNCTITGDSINCQTLKTRISGKGSTIVKGETINAENSISGEGTINQLEMFAKSVSIKMSGKGNIYVNVSEELSVKISGSGNVYYKGNPKIEQSISGVGKVIDSNK